MKIAQQLYPSDSGFKRNLQYKTIQRIGAHRRWYALEGVVFIVFGILAMLAPGLTALAANFTAGILLLAGGILRLLNGLQFHYSRGWRIASGIAMALAGGAMMYWPAAGTQSLIICIGFLLIAEGMVQISMAMTYRSSRGWGWLLFSGFVAIVLGAILLGAGPGAGMIVTAFIIGLSLSIYGMSLTLLALGTRK